ncbi:MAG: DUF6431 domain-containing protein [Lachnospiraceae bacterium]|nr:DUF6431 domain-containing protein [Lachnospiraceae bacterium]
MVRENESECPNCGEKLKRYDEVQRIVRTKGRHTNHVKIQRLRCPGCGHVHRELPSYIFPYKQYNADVIQGVIEGFITPETLGFEDYLCEMTMIRWRTQNPQLLLGHL